MAPRRQKKPEKNKKSPPGRRRILHEDDTSPSSVDSSLSGQGMDLGVGAGFAMAGGGGVAVSVGGVAGVAGVAGLAPRVQLKNPYKKDVVTRIKKAPKMNLDFLSQLQFSPAKGRSRQTIPMEERTSRLLCSLIGGGDKAIVFRFEPDGQYSAWGEKVLSDQIRRCESWADALNFEKRPLKWCIDDRPMFNMQNYPIRLFAIPLLQLPPREIIVEIGKQICAQVNAEPSNTAVARVDPNGFFWIEHETTWQVLISIADTLARLADRVGPPDDNNYFERNRSKILSYFALGTINHELARRIRAPPEMIHPRFVHEEDYENESEPEEGDEEEEADGEEGEEVEEGAIPDEDDEMGEEKPPANPEAVIDEKKLRDAFADSDDEDAADAAI